MFRVSVALPTALISVLAVAACGGGGGGDADGESLKVTFGDTMGECDEYTNSYVVETRVTLEDADGSILDSITISGEGTEGTAPGESRTTSCLWDIELNNVTESNAYQLTFELPAGQFGSAPPEPQTLTYSYDELVEADWHLELGKNF